MHILDEKGRLGGKLNIIDLIAILVVLAAVAAVVILGGRGQEAESVGTPQHVVFTVKVQGVDADVFESVREQVPCQLMAEDVLQDAYVTKVEGTLVKEDDETRIEEAAHTYYVGLTPGAAGTYDVVCTIEGNVSDSVVGKIGPQEIRIGRAHIVKTSTYELDYGIITSLETSPIEE